MAELLLAPRVFLADRSPDLIIAIARRNSLVLRAYEDRVSLEKGLMSKEVTGVFIHDVTGIEITQSAWQRLVGLGNMLVGTPSVSRWDDAARSRR